MEKVQSQNDHCALARILHSFLNQASATGCPWSTVQMSSYCSPTMTNHILSTTSQNSCLQLRWGLPRLSAQELLFPSPTGKKPHGDPCADMGLKEACSASGRVKFQVCKFFFSGKKTKTTKTKHQNKTSYTINCRCPSVISIKPTWINQDQMYCICPYSLQPHISI